MSPGVVLTAGQPKNKSAVAGMAVEAEATDSRGKCTLQYAPLAARTPRSPSSPETGARCTAPTATQKRGGRDKGSTQLPLYQIGLMGRAGDNGQLEMVPDSSL